MNNLPAMTGAWMTQQQMQSEANIYRHDNDEGTYAWFDATEALWTEGYLSPVAFHHIFKPNEAGAWLDNEIALLEEDGRDAKSYREIRKGETKNPVVVVFDNGRAIVWDGFHRIAAAVARNEPVYAIYTIPPVPVLKAVNLPKAKGPQFIYHGGKGAFDAGKDAGFNEALLLCTEALYAAGYEVKQ